MWYSIQMHVCRNTIFLKNFLLMQLRFYKNIERKFFYQFPLGCRECSQNEEPIIWRAHRKEEGALGFRVTCGSACVRLADDRRDMSHLSSWCLMSSLLMALCWNSISSELSVVLDVTSLLKNCCMSNLQSRRLGNSFQLFCSGGSITNVELIFKKITLFLLYERAGLEFFAVQCVTSKFHRIGLHWNSRFRSKIHLKCTSPRLFVRKSLIQWPVGWAGLGIFVG